MQFLNGFLCTLVSENQTPNYEKSLNYIGKFNIRSLPHAIFIPTWSHFGSKNLPKSRLGGVLGRLGGLLRRLGRVLERLGLILERLGGILERLGRVLKRLEAENASWKRPGSQAGPGTPLRLAPENLHYQDTERLTVERLPTERLQTSVDRVRLNVDTQLGAFGPGADPTAQQSYDPAAAPAAKL